WEKVIERTLLHTCGLADVLHTDRAITIPPYQFDCGIEQAILGVTDTSHDLNIILDRTVKSSGKLALPVKIRISHYLKHSPTRPLRSFHAAGLGSMYRRRSEGRDNSLARLGRLLS